MGKPVDARADIYAAGLVLYSLLVGRGPFAHLDPIAALSEQPEPPSVHAPQAVPTDLDVVVMKAIDEAPEQRFQSAEAFIAAHDGIAASLGQTPQLPSSQTANPGAMPDDEGRGWRRGWGRAVRATRR